MSVPCPSCGHLRCWKIRRDKRRCKRCRREFAPLRFPVKGFRLTSDGWKKAVAAFLEHRSVRRLAEALMIAPRHAQEIAHHLRTRMTHEKLPVFIGPVELDETYIGAQRKNQRMHIRKLYPPKRGHGTRKLPIFGIFDRASGLVQVKVLRKKLDVEEIRMAMRVAVLPDARVFTDGLPAYRKLSKDGFRHEWVDHNLREYVRGDVHTNNIEGFWGIMKRTMGTIGGMRRNRLDLFAAEIGWRFNHRKDTREEKERALVALVLQD